MCVTPCSWRSSKNRARPERYLVVMPRLSCSTCLYNRLEFQSVLTHPHRPALRNWSRPLIIDLPTGATSVQRTILLVPMVSALERFHCSLMLLQGKPWILVMYLSNTGIVQSGLTLIARGLIEIREKIEF